ncbi:MAG: PAS domain-containing protein [Planctomycetes bacterium]|nr:PAS domain-containing protein [Planctomycetota bacterium]
MTHKDPNALLEALPVGACVVDPRGNVLVWNAALAGWSGVSRERALGRSVVELLPFLSDAAARRRLEAVLKGGPPAVLTSPLHRGPVSDRPGSPRAHRTTIARLPGAPADEPRALITIQDSTALAERVRAFRKQKDALSRELSARRRSEWLLQRKAELLELFGKRVSTETVLSRLLECILSLSPRISTWMELRPRDAAPQLYLGRALRDEGRSEHLLPLQSAGLGFLGSLHVTVPYEAPLSEPELEALAILSNVACMALEHEHAERSRSVLSAIVRSNYDAIIGYAPDDTIESWNAAAEQMLGYRAEEVLGKPLEAVLGSALGSELNDIVLCAKHGKTFGDIETQWRRKDGRNIALSLTLSPIRHEDGAVLGTAIIARDITERRRHEEELLSYTQAVEEGRRRVEEQAHALKRQSELLADARDEALRASRVKAEFLSTISHEIRTPMNGIIGMTEHLLETPLDEQQLDCVRTIQASGDALLMIINDILDISKIEAGKLTFEQVPFDLRRTIEEIVVMSRLQAFNKGITLELDWPEDLAREFESDPLRIGQVVMNLVSNAIKFTATGGVRVTVLAGTEQDGRVPVVLEVRDTGIGISPEHLEHIFEAFQQADSTTTRRFGGTGLGLAICKSICDGLGGSIAVESVAGHGAAFRVTLPLRRAAGSVEPSRGTPLRAGQSFDARVLLVEDNPVNQRVATAALIKLGCTVEVVANGREALDYLEREPFDLVLMDCQMPVMNGYDATREARARRLCDATPIVAMTANTMDGDYERCIAAGMNGYLAKPFKRAELAEVLAEHCCARKRGEDVA